MIHRQGLTRTATSRNFDSPHTQHIDEVLLSDIVLLVDIALQRGENVSFLHDILSTSTFDVEEGCVGNAVFVGGCVTALWRYSKILEFLSEHDDGLFAEKGILGGRGTKVRGRPIKEVLLSSKQTGGACGAIKRVRRISEEIEDICKALWIKL